MLIIVKTQVDVDAQLMFHDLRAKKLVGRRQQQHLPV